VPVEEVTMPKIMLAIALVLGLVVLGGREARADTEWYGWQTLAVDVGAVALAGIATRQGSASLAYLAIGSYALAAPIVHFAHGEGGRGGGSLGLRLGLPILVGFALSQAEQSNCSGEFCGLGGLVVGAGLGVLTAIVLDASALAWHRRRLPVQPVVAIDRERTVVGASTTF
jgi:hypothetical protein